MKYNYIKINSFLISFLPITLIFSIFITDLIVSLTSVFFLVFIFLKKKFFVFKYAAFKFFLIFYSILIIGSFFSDYSSYSFLKTLPYIRFGLFLLLIGYLLDNDENFINIFLKSILISFSILIFGLILQLFEVEFIYKFINGSRYSSFFLMS